MAPAATVVTAAAAVPAAAAVTAVARLTVTAAPAATRQVARPHRTNGPRRLTQGVNRTAAVVLMTDAELMLRTPGLTGLCSRMAADAAGAVTGTETGHLCLMLLTGQGPAVGAASPAALPPQVLVAGGQMAGLMGELQLPLLNLKAASSGMLWQMTGAGGTGKGPSGSTGSMIGRTEDSLTGLSGRTGGSLTGRRTGSMTGGAMQTATTGGCRTGAAGTMSAVETGTGGSQAAIAAGQVPMSLSMRRRCVRGPGGRRMCGSISSGGQTGGNLMRRMLGAGGGMMTTMLTGAISMLTGGTHTGVAETWTGVRGVGVAEGMIGTGAMAGSRSRGKLITAAAGQIGMSVSTEQLGSVVKRGMSLTAEGVMCEKAGPGRQAALLGAGVTAAAAVAAVGVGVAAVCR